MKKIDYIKILNDLLKPLDLMIDYCQINNGATLVGITCIDNEMIPVWYKTLTGTWSTESCARLMFQRLISDITVFIVAPATTQKVVKNPYFGCKSIEEAYITKDLIYNGHI